MEKLSRQEILSILGLGPDPKHSLLWYASNYPDLRNIIWKHISEEIDREGIFPLEAKALETQKRCIKFSWLIIKRDDSNILVLTNDTDHGLVLDEQSFSNFNDAVNSFLEKTYCAGGAIKQFLREEGVIKKNKKTRGHKKNSGTRGTP